MKEVKFRGLSKDDLEQVVAIQASITRSQVSERWQKMLSDHVGSAEQIGIVAELQGRVIGFIIGEIKVGGFGSELAGWFEMVGVMPEHMGSGIGRQLGRELLKSFHSQGVEEVFTAVRWDSGDMLAFFKSLGFDRSPLINLQLSLRDD